MLPNRHNKRFRLPEALFWAASWGVGAAIGVALGGWLTLVGGSGAPGAEALDPLSDLVMLPAAAFAVVAIMHLGAQMLAASLRGRAVARGKGERDSENHEEHSIPG